MSFSSEEFEKQIPYYLTDDPGRKAFVKELEALNNGAKRGYTLARGADPHHGVMLQGDGWQGFRVLSMDTGSREIKGLVLSNSCDVSAENSRAIPAKVAFAPLVKLSKLIDRFRSAQIPEQAISSRIDAIKSQSVTNLFYLPEDGALDSEYVVLLDDIHSMPAGLCRENGRKLFTLSMPGFYLFVFKLSIHFCRLHEGIDRSRASA